MSIETQTAWNVIKQACAQLPLSKWEDRETIAAAVKAVETALTSPAPTSSAS